MIELTAADGHNFSAYRAEPAGEPRGAVVVIQEIFGVNDHIRAVADGFAAAGYVAVAPALFDREKPGVELGYDEAGIAAGTDLMGKVGTDGPLADIQAAIDAVRPAGRVAVVGYCWGGYLAYASANRAKGLACAISYYGVGVVDEFREKRRVPTLLHFGEADELAPPAKVEQFRAARPDVSAFTYPAGHGFNCDARPSYDAAAANAARERTLFWVSQYVDGQGPIALKNAGAYAAAKMDKKKSKKPADDQGPPME